ncbi:MAG: hypothetical protein ACRD1R_01840 [Acidobacteriota bacterium]
MFTKYNRLQLTLCWFLLVYFLSGGQGLSQTIDPSQDHLFFASIVTGRAGDLAFQSFFRVSNEKSESASGQVQLFSSGGSSFPAPENRWIGPAGSVQSQDGVVHFDLPPATFLELTLPALEELAVGWASARSDEGLDIKAFFQVARPDEEDPFDFRNSLEREVEILPTRGAIQFSFPASLFVGDQSMNTAFSLVNLALVPAQVRLTLDRGGEESSASITLEGQEMIAAYFDQFFTLVLPAIFPAELNAVLSVESEQPLAVAVFRTLSGLPLSPVAPRIARPPEDDLAVSPGQEFTLAFGQTASVEGTTLTLEFVDVSHDSRCPIDVVCIDAGEARVVVRVRQVESISEMTLATRGELKQAGIGELILELLDVEPDPISTRQIPLSEYRIKLSLQAE